MGNSALAQFITCSDTSFLVQLGNTTSKDVHHKVMALYNTLKDQIIEGIVTLVPSYCAVMVIYDPVVTCPNRLRPNLEIILSDLIENPPPYTSKTVEIPVCYGGIYGPDLPHVARYCKLSPQEVIACHSAVEYPIFMMGFSPGFPLLGNLDPQLHTPRLTAPRARVPEGSVGIADDQTGIYSTDGPGEWQLIGRTPLKLFFPKNATPYRYQIGDHIRFVPIKPEEYHHIKNKEAP
jgi:KipI family sensor histidine kinase inhibitor